VIVTILACLKENRAQAFFSACLLRAGPIQGQNYRLSVAFAHLSSLKYGFGAFGNLGVQISTEKARAPFFHETFRPPLSVPLGFGKADTAASGAKRTCGEW